MSMNLYGYFKDSKGRSVSQLPFIQTPTDLSYRVIPRGTEEIILTQDNWKEKLKIYFDWVKEIYKTDPEQYSNHIEEFKNLFDDYGQDYQAHIFVI